MGSRALVFAGQGAQFVGMGKDLAEAYPECWALFDRADKILGYELSKICFKGPIKELTKSNNCQPAIFVTSIACYKALCLEAGDFGFKGAAGLSLGEWSALHMADALTFEDALRVLEARGRFMQEACEEHDGAMVSVIGLSIDKLKEICSAASVEIANINSAEQTVLSGGRGEIEAAERMAKDAGAKRVIVLNVAGAFHSSLMASAATRLEQVLSGVKISRPCIPVVANVTGRPHGGTDEIRRDMVKQVTSPVQWLSCVRWFRDNGVTEYVECGPGKVLSGLIKRIDSEAVIHSIENCETLGKTIERVQH